MKPRALLLGEDVLPESVDLGLLSVADQLEAEDLLYGLEQRVVVVVRRAHGAGLDEGGQGDRADAATAGPPQARLVRIRVGRVVVAEAVLLAAACGGVLVVARLVERDEDGEAIIRGTQVARNLSAWTRPPFAPFWQRGMSCASAHVSGVIQE